MKFLKLAAIAAVLFLPTLSIGVEAKAATASQYSAKGHGRHPTMSNRPSRAVYHRSHRHMRRHGY